MIKRRQLKNRQTREMEVLFKEEMHMKKEQEQKKKEKEHQKKEQQGQGPRK